MTQLLLMVVYKNKSDIKTLVLKPALFLYGERTQERTFQKWSRHNWMYTPQPEVGIQVESKISESTDIIMFFAFSLLRHI